MKRRALSSLLLVPAFPLTVLFVLTARPARLYAESAVATECSSPGVTACEGKSWGDGCTSPQGPAFCQPSTCLERDDGGASNFPRKLQCLFAPVCATQAQLSACDGKSAGAACSTEDYDGACAASLCPTADGGEVSIRACVPATRRPDAGSSSSSGAAESGTPESSSSDGGCSAAPGGVASSGTLVGLLLAAAAFVRRARGR